MTKNLISEDSFVSLSAVLLRRFWAALLGCACLGAAALCLFDLAGADRYQATAIVTLTDWQTERLTRRDDPADKNPANVGGASADDMSRSLVLLKDADFFRALPFKATAEQLSVDHKRRGNLVTLKWSSSAATLAETELTQLIQAWDQALRQRFSAQKQQELHKLQQLAAQPVAQTQLTQLQFELDYALSAQPFALRVVQEVKAPEHSTSPALWQLLFFGAVIGFSCGFILLMLWRL